jgi:hypothetical protein
MSMKKIASGELVSVDADKLMDAVEFARARFAAVHANGSHTLIDDIPDDAWATWGDEGENVLVADSDGIDGRDPLDDDALLSEAA